MNEFIIIINIVCIIAITYYIIKLKEQLKTQKSRVDSYGKSYIDSLKHIEEYIGVHKAFNRFNNMLKLMKISLSVLDNRARELELVDDVESVRVELSREMAPLDEMPVKGHYQVFAYIDILDKLFYPDFIKDLERSLLNNNDIVDMKLAMKKGLYLSLKPGIKVTFLDYNKNNLSASSSFTSVIKLTTNEVMFSVLAVDDIDIVNNAKYMVINNTMDIDTVYEFIGSKILIDNVIDKRLSASINKYKDYMPSLDLSDITNIDNGLDRMDTLFNSIMSTEFPDKLNEFSYTLLKSHILLSMTKMQSRVNELLQDSLIDIADDIAGKANA